MTKTTMRTFHIDDADKFATRVARGGANNPQNDNDHITATIQSIMESVRQRGDRAVLEYEKKFASTHITSLRVSKAEIRGAYTKVSQAEIDAIHLAKTRLKETESALISALDKDVTVQAGDGITVRKRLVPIRSVGCYVPGGLARYPSTVVMSVVPARIAGVQRVVVVSPPAGDSGRHDPLTVVAADICGADEIYRTGGAQSIAALSYGTKTIAKVDKIVGPGGAFVTAAKHLASSHTAIDMLAGPTELGIVADATADPTHIALDLISQAEHSCDTMCYLITTSSRLARQVDQIVTEMLPHIQRRAMVEPSLKNNGFIAICRSGSEMVRLANALAPEHIEIMTRDPAMMASKITSPGLVLLGSGTPSAASDYILGSNHVLPTCGFGRTRGPLSVLDFVKMATQVECGMPTLTSPETLKCLAALTGAEGLPNHYAAVADRLKDVDGATPDTCKTDSRTAKNTTSHKRSGSSTTPKHNGGKTSTTRHTIPTPSASILGLKKKPNTRKRGTKR